MTIEILAGMQSRLLTVSVLLLVPASLVWSAASRSARLYERMQADGGVARRRWLNEDLHLVAGSLVTYRFAPGGHVLLCRQGVSMTMAGREYASDRAVVWIDAAGTGTAWEYQVRVYIAGDVSGLRGRDGQEGGLEETVLERGRAAVVRVGVGGEIYVTAEERQTANPAGLPLFQEAMEAFGRAGLDLPAEWESAAEPPVEAAAAFGQAEEVVREERKAGYTVGIAPIGDVAPRIERRIAADGREVITVIGRVYVSWQEAETADEEPKTHELQADSLVLWGAPGAEGGAPGLSAGEQVGVSEIYVAGDVLLRQGEHTIRADELYYDLRGHRALATNAVMKTFDTKRNVPVYVRAAELRQVAEGQFEAENVTMTTSEFWLPQLSLEAARIEFIYRPQDTDQRAGGDSGFDAELKDVRFRYNTMTILKLPNVHATGGKPDIPIRSLRFGHDRTYGTSVETGWHLAKLLGLREAEGTDGTLALDYYGERGLGGGVYLEYARDKYFGSLLGYAIDDNGPDRLSRTRTNVPVPDEMRGRFGLQHRQFLPYGWQLTAEASYLSDKNFLEQFYRTEFNIGKEQETLLHLKRIEDNWGLSLLGKGQINDFMGTVEESPTAEYHLMGQSLFGNRFTFYSDNQVSRYRYRTGTDDPDGKAFAFMGTRNELDLPLEVGRSRVVPYVAGTFGYDDGGGFQSRLDDGLVDEEDAIAIGEAGVRMSLPPYWAVYSDVESRFWDVHQVRHVIRPSLVAATYVETDAVAEQRDTVNLEIAQRWQTKRGPLGRRRTVDWLELDLDFVWVADSSDEMAGPDRFLWSRPFIPLTNPIGSVIPPLDRRSSDLFGPRQHYVSAEMIWRATDTTSVLGDVYFDMPNGIVEQLDVGVSRLVWPDLSYYVGSRYLRDVETGLGRRGSNALIFAATYVLDPRYTVILAEQYDFDYGSNVQTDLTLVRKYHRMNLALTFSADESLGEERVVLSLWPEGVSELAIGLRRYMGLGVSDVYH